MAKPFMQKVAEVAVSYDGLTYLSALSCHWLERVNLVAS